MPRWQCFATFTRTIFNVAIGLRVMNAYRIPSSDFLKQCPQTYSIGLPRCKSANWNVQDWSKLKPTLWLGINP